MDQIQLLVVGLLALSFIILFGGIYWVIDNHEKQKRGNKIH